MITNNLNFTKNNNTAFTANNKQIQIQASNSNYDANTILKDFLENFENALQAQMLDETLLQRLEAQKPFLSNAIASKSIDSKLLRKFIQVTLNQCKLLNFNHKNKDQDNDFYLFRLKEIISDFYSLFLTYTSHTEITNSDIFNYINIIIDFATEQKKILNTIFIESYQERIDLIINFLFSKESEIEVMLSMDKKYYETVFNYFAFVLENFCDIEAIDNLFKEHYEKKENVYLKVLSMEEIENKVFMLLYKILFYVRKLKIIHENHASKKFFFVLAKKLFALLDYLNKTIFNFASVNSKAKIYGNSFKNYKENENEKNSNSLNWIFESEIDFSDFTYEELVENVINNQDIFKADNEIKIIFVFYFFVNLKHKENVDKIYICEIYKMFFDFFVNFKEFYAEFENNSRQENNQNKTIFFNNNAAADEDETNLRKNDILESFCRNENQDKSIKESARQNNLMDLEDDPLNKGMITTQQAKLEANETYLKLNKNSNFSLSKIDMEFDYSSKKINNQNATEKANLTFHQNPNNTKSFEREIDLIIREILTYMIPESKQELEFLVKQLEYQLKCSKNFCNGETYQSEVNSMFFLLYKILNHSEFSLAYLEDILKIISLHGNADSFFSCFLKQLNQNQQKNVIKISNSNKLVLSQEVLLNYPILNFLFIYNFFNSNLFKSFFEELDFVKQTLQERNYTDKGKKSIFSNININKNSATAIKPNNPNYNKNNSMNNNNNINYKTFSNEENFLNLNNESNINLLFEILKLNSSCLLDAYSANLYTEPHINSIIPSFLKNIVIMLLKIESESDKFLSYFIFDVLKKIKNSEFLELAVEVYIEKKDYIKLANLVNSEKCAKEEELTCLVIYAQIICILNDGNKWNTINLLNKKCLVMNQKADFHIFYYIKLVQFLIKSNLDLSLGMSILNHFAIVYFELIKHRKFEKLVFDNYIIIGNKRNLKGNENSFNNNTLNFNYNNINISGIDIMNTTPTFNCNNQFNSSVFSFSNSNIKANITSNKIYNNNMHNLNCNLNTKDSNMNKTNSSFYLNKSDNNIFLVEIILEFFSWTEKINPEFVFSPIIFDLITQTGEFFEFAFLNETITNHFTNNLTRVFQLINFLLNFKNPNKKKLKIAEEYPEHVLSCACKLLNFMFLNSKNFFEEFYENVERTKKTEQFSLILDLLEIYKSLTLYYISYENSSIISEEDEISEEFVRLFIKNHKSNSENNNINLTRISENSSNLEDNWSLSAGNSNFLKEINANNIGVDFDKEFANNINGSNYPNDSLLLGKDKSNLISFANKHANSKIEPQIKKLTHAKLLKKFAKYNEIFKNTLAILEDKIEDFFSCNNLEIFPNNLNENISINSSNNNIPIDKTKEQLPIILSMADVNNPNSSFAQLNPQKQNLLDRISGIKRSTAFVEDILKIEIISKDLFSKHLQLVRYSNNLAENNPTNNNISINKTNANINALSNFNANEFSNFIETTKHTIFELVDKYIENKKLIFLIISKVYHCGMKKLLVDLNRKILNLLFTNADLIKFYSIEEVLGLYKDIINLSESKSEKISELTEYSNMVVKNINRSNEHMLNEYFEWIFYQIYLIMSEIEAESSKGMQKNFNENTEVNELKKLVVDLQKGLPALKNKSFVLNNLMEILFRKFLSFD